MRSALFTLALAAIVPASRPLPAASPCRVERFEGDAFIACAADPGRHEIRLARRQEDGRPGSLAELERSLGAAGSHVLFAMNAGMYDPARMPVGLYVADGQEEQPLNLNAGHGNFFLKPNGVFWIDRAGRPHVDESAAFARSRARPLWATQSGPLLLRGGAMHPAVSENGTSLHVRNAVGVSGDRAWFVISERPVSFGRLARFLRDRLDCADALYLDGTVSSLWAPVLGRRDRRRDLGTFVVVLER